MGRVSAHQSYLKIATLSPTLVAHCSGQEVCSNIGYVRYKSFRYLQSSQKSRALEALECGQFEKDKKIAFSASSYDLITSLLHVRAA